MDEILEILQDIDPDIDYETADRLIDDKMLDSFSIVALVSEIADAFDITIQPQVSDSPELQQRQGHVGYGVPHPRGGGLKLFSRLYTGYMV